MSLGEFKIETRIPDSSQPEISKIFETQLSVSLGNTSIGNLIDAFRAHLSQIGFDLSFENLVRELSMEEDDFEFDEDEVPPNDLISFQSQILSSVEFAEKVFKIFKDEMETD